MRDPKTATTASPAWALRRPREESAYPTGMVWCPMKMSGMAILRCARLQKSLGCGSRRELRTLKSARPQNKEHLWPWLRRREVCPERATEAEVRELLMEITPLRLIKGGKTKMPADRCPHCGGRKVAQAQQCRRCWTTSVTGKR